MDREEVQSVKRCPDFEKKCFDFGYLRILGGNVRSLVEVVPGQPPAQPLDQVVEEHLDVAAAGEAAQVEVAARVGQGALVRPPEIQRIWNQS